ncbi:hypothetical protein SAMN06298212_10742 [Ruaniaceae bacterium KH17]|nr:hypothetical protein SAMN06298212_10742 [Ruaniaceae bacterium KH17]
MRTEAPLLAPLFRSEGQAQLLSTVLLTDDELVLSDLAGRAGLAYATAHREVARLVGARILVERQVGRARLVSANPESPLVAPLRQILSFATGPVPLLAEEFASVGGIERAFFYGSFAARASGVLGAAPNDIDVMMIGDPSPEETYAACDRVEERVHRPVNPTILSREEVARDSDFLEQVRSNPILPVIGEDPWRNRAHK